MALSKPHTSKANAKVEPLFFRNSSVIGEATEVEDNKLRHIDVVECISKVVQREQIDTVQIVRGLWKIYMKTTEARVSLYNRGIDVRGIHISLYDLNPYRTRSEDPAEVIERITFKDLSPSVDDSMILDWAEKLPYELRSKVQYSRVRNRLNKMTEVKTGDRFILVKGPIIPVLPTRIKIGQFTARCFHDSQFKVCRVCGDSGHKWKDPECPAYDPDQMHALFKGYEHPMSNFFRVDEGIQWKNKMFDSTEHAFQWERAMYFGEPDLAEEIRLAIHAGAAKAIADRFLPPDGEDEVWDSIAPEIMKDINRIKMETSEIARNTILETGEALIAEATGDTVWACGLPKEIAQDTVPRFFKGKNKLGKILMELRAEYRWKEMQIQTQTLNANDAAIKEWRNEEKQGISDLHETDTSQGEEEEVLINKNNQKNTAEDISTNGTNAPNLSKISEQEEVGTEGNSTNATTAQNVSEISAQEEVRAEGEVVESSLETDDIEKVVRKSEDDEFHTGITDVENETSSSEELTSDDDDETSGPKEPSYMQKFLKAVHLKSNTPSPKVQRKPKRRRQKSSPNAKPSSPETKKSKNKGNSLSYIKDGIKYIDSGDGSLPEERREPEPEPSAPPVENDDWD